MTNMKRYEDYKDSGVQWLGEIPSHWETLPLRYYISFTKGRNPGETTDAPIGYPYLTMDYLRGREDKITLYPKDPQNMVLVEDGDPLVLWDGSNAGEFIKARKGYLGSTMAKIAFNEEKYFNEYFFYLLKSIELVSKDFAGGTTIPHFDSDVLIKENYPCPSLKEQEVIAAYLDQKVGMIDDILSEKEEMVEQLQQYRKSLISETVTRGLNPNAPMKDSGIDWIGQIPEHWELVKLKSIAKVNGRIGYRGYTTEDLVHDGNGAYAIGGKHISKCVLDLTQPDFISWEKYYESPEIMVRKGDLLMAQRGSLGKVALVRDDIGEATINPSLVLINNLKIGDVFLYYYLVSNSCLTYIQLLNTATAVPMISQNQIENLFVPVPSVVEQHAISAFLDKKTNELDTTISELQSQIEDLKAYKSSVISEAVTGKVDLRDWKPS